MSSWNECNLPTWFDHVSKHQGNEAAEHAFPNEVCGFFVQMDACVQLYTFHGISNPYWCSANPNEVIQFAYWVKEKSGIVLASFHTHPKGGNHPSDRDHMLSMWAKTHLIWVRQEDDWDIRTFHTNLFST